MSQDIKFVQLTLKIDGSLCNVVLSDDAKRYLLAMLPVLSDEGSISVYELPDDFKEVSYSELRNKNDQD